MRRRLHVIAAAVSMVALACAGCAGSQSALDPRGVQAETLMHLIGSIVAVCTVVWVLVVMVLLRAIWRRRRRAIDDTAVDDATERRMKRTITLAISATVIVVIALTTISFFATRHITKDEPNALVVRVRGWQWWWEVTYPDARPDHTVVTANEIHVPVGRQVRVELAAADVIHSFWVPNLAGKQDMIPGRDNTLVFTATRAGVYRGQCAEFCGLQHAHMALVVIADEPADFEAWRVAQLADAQSTNAQLINAHSLDARSTDAQSAGAQLAASPRDSEIDFGRKVFLAKACASCHTVRGTPAAGTLGPDLTHVGSRRTIAAGLFETTRGSLAAWIADPQTLKPGNNMPMVDLSADELKAVSAYMESLR